MNEIVEIDIEFDDTYETRMADDMDWQSLEMDEWAANSADFEQNEWQAYY